jgi:hypothetical protein
MAYKEPSVKEKAEKKELSLDEIEFIKDLRMKVDKDDNDREIWKYKLISAANQRLGIKRVTNYPYHNAPDIPLPETDKIIKKQVPNLVLSSWSAKKLCSVKVKSGIRTTPQLIMKAKNSEDGMNLVLREEMDLFNKFELAADNAKEKGHCIFKIVEEFKSRKVHKVIDLDDYDDEVIKKLRSLKNDELKMFLADRYELDQEDDDDKKTLDDIVSQFRNGDDIIEFDVYEYSSLPNIEIPLPNKIIVPSYTTDIADAERLTHEYFLTRHELEERFDNEIFIKKNLEEIGIKSGNDDDILTQQKDQIEGVISSTAEDDLFRIREVYCWYKPEGADCYERWVFTFLADVMAHEDSILRMIPFPFEFEGWNFERFDNERKDPRHYNSRGVPEQIRALQEVLERAINNMLIRDEHNNNPVYGALETSEMLQRDTSFAPGEILPMSQQGEVWRIDEKQIPDVSSQNIIQLIKAFAEEYQASSDQLFRNATNTGGGKTLGEIERGIQMNSGPLTLEVVRWNETLSKVYTKVFKIMQERLGDSIWVEGTEITKEDFNFPATVKSNGSLEVSDMNLATQKAWMRLQAAMQMQQFNVADLEDLYNSYRDWLEKDGVKDPEMYSTNPQAVLQGKLMQMQQQLQQMASQIQQNGKLLDAGQKEIAKVKKTFKEETNNFEGEMEAISNGAYSKSESGTS